MGDNIEGSQVLRFWRLMPKGEKVLSPKQKDRTTKAKGLHHHFKNCQKLKEVFISIVILF
jgi:hypothetical protein